MSNSSFLVAAILGGFVPLVTAVLTKASAVVRTKATVAKVLVVGAGIVSAATTDTFDAKGAATTIVTALLGLAASYSHLWKPLGVVGPADRPGVLDRVTAGVGLG